MNGSNISTNDTDRKEPTHVIPPRPTSAHSRQMTSVNSMQHASLVIRSLRAHSHSQKSYHRSACQDDNVLSSLRHFDHLVIQQASDLEKANRVSGLISDQTMQGGGGGGGVGRGTGSNRVADTGDSSDDEWEPSAEKSASDGCDWPGESKIQKVAPPLTSISALPDRRSYDESERKFYGGGDSDDSDFFGDDDDDDMADLMSGFVPPRVTGADNNSSATRDLDDPGEPSAQQPAPSPHRSRSHQRRTKTSENQPRTQSAGSAGESVLTSLGGDLALSASGPISLPGKGNDKLKGRERRVDGTSSSGSSSSKKHHVMITPGQRIRVRPSGKKAK